MAKTNNLTDFLTDVANAIREKEGSGEAINPQVFSSRILALQTGGGGGGVTINNQEKSVDITENGTTEVVADAGFTGLSKVVVNTNVASSGGGTTIVSPKDVNFRDYDGTVLYAYTKDEFLALNELPPLPTQPGLICQGWNWSLEDAKAYVQEYEVLDVGATYITDDGKTRLYISIATKGRTDVPLNLQQTKANGVVVDWGDGTSETFSSTGILSIVHHYDTFGEYVISLEVADGNTLTLGNGSSKPVIDSSPYSGMLKRVEIGSGVKSIANKAFKGNYSLSYVVVPDNVRTIADEAFNGCCSLSFVVIPQWLNSIGVRAFRGCTAISSVIFPKVVSSVVNDEFRECSSLVSVVIPKNVTSIGNGAFYNCYSLSSVIVPNSVTSIDSAAFRYCYGVGIYNFRTHAAVPTLYNTDAFYSIASDCKIVVPDVLYDEWIAATNWSTYASKIVKASEFNG